MALTLNKFEGCIVGGAVGDALGFLTEKIPIVETKKFVDQFINSKTYSISFRTFPRNYKFGQYSDDTQFSRIMLENLVNHKNFNKESYFEDLIKFHKHGKLVGLGKSTNNILKAASKNKDISSLILNNSNGSLMRSFPIGLFYSSKELILNYSDIQSRLTHNTDEAVKACQMMALTIDHLKEKDTDSLLSFWEANNLLDLNFSFLEMKLKEAQQHIHTISPSEGWEYVTPSAKATFAAVCYCINQETIFEQGILTALSLGGDTDSVASLVGASLGLVMGKEKIPSYWQNIVHDEGFFDQSYLTDLAKQVWQNKK